MIDVNNVSKEYVRKEYARKTKNNEKAVKSGIKNISFSVGQGEVFGLLGPNGAGKTTMIRLLMGFIKADSGKAQIKGFDCWYDSVALKKIIGYLPGELNFISQMSGLEFLNLMAGMHGNLPVYRERRIHLAERLDLNLKQPIEKMSKGMKQKLGIIYALMLDAEVLILDEPTTGLDPLMQREFINLLLEEKARGKTIFVSSHIFSEIEKICDRVGIIRAGKLVSIQNIQELKEKQIRTFELHLAEEQDIKVLEKADLAVNRVQGNRVEVTVKGDLNPFFKTLAKVNLTDFMQKASQLEESFMEFYEGR